MVADQNEELRARALRAYERGRLGVAALGALPFAVLAAIAGCARAARSPMVLVTGVLLFAAAIFLRWRGRELGRGALVGGAAGLVPFVGLHVARVASSFESARTCAIVCGAVAIVTGTVAGLHIGRFAARTARPVAAWTSAAAVAALTGALGCLSIGAGALAGVVFGIVAGSAAGALHQARRSLG